MSTNISTVEAVHFSGLFLFAGRAHHSRTRYVHVCTKRVHNKVLRLSQSNIAPQRTNEQKPAATESTDGHPRRGFGGFSPRWGFTWGERRI